MTQNNYNKDYKNNHIDINKMSIEDIKRLTDRLISSPNIYTLTGAAPEIIDIAAYWSTTGVGAVLVLWKNTGGYGWVRIEGWARNTSGPDVKLGEFANCFDTILPLGYIQQITTNTLYTFGFGKTYYCPTAGATEICTYPTSCSAPNLQVIYPSTKDIPFMPYDSTIPTIPPSLSITAGDGQLTISWGASTGPDIFAYFVKVEGNVLKFGHVRASTRTVTVGGLTNYVSYSIEVRAVSTSNVPSNAATGSETPIPPCPTMGTPILTIPS